MPMKTLCQNLLRGLLHYLDSDQFVPDVIFELGPEVWHVGLESEGHDVKACDVMRDESSQDFVLVYFLRNLYHTVKRLFLGRPGEEEKRKVSLRGEVDFILGLYSNATRPLSRKRNNECRTARQLNPS